ncbi:hypothetical protein EVAR_24669_1 [Eumeta japonica]|uniref:Uncharacterized protein n=1 Tax=Eumeta variegata TaxID=151549 RepID=A0A4C1WGU4_EUMVA|nr:hypothetical protein EVAR_24669_1 [Eumeta japonica]
MPALLFDTCCGCINLRTGCLIIGYLQLVCEIIFGIMILIMLTVSGVVASGAVHPEYSSADRSNLQRELQFEFPKDNDIQGLGILLVVVCVILLLALALALAFTITLLVGVHQGKRGHVKAYLIYTTIFLVLALIMFFVSLSSKNDAGSIVGNLLSFGQIEPKPKRIEIESETESRIENGIKFTNESGSGGQTGCGTEVGVKSTTRIDTGKHLFMELYSTLNLHWRRVSCSNQLVSENYLKCSHYFPRYA